VTERFFRGPDTAGQPGTGLGLALVSAIVGLHKWHLDIEDARPGTRVRIRC
jgi:signal transduction histidine kinase